MLKGNLLKVSMLKGNMLKDVRTALFLGMVFCYSETVTGTCSRMNIFRRSASKTLNSVSTSQI